MKSDGNVIHFVTDKWITPSIKDTERVNRCSSSAHYEIKGPNQKRPSNWNEALKNTNFKVALNKFLVDAWCDNSLATIFEGKTMYANCADKCYKFKVHGDSVLRREESRLFSTHEEADSRMFHHTAFSANKHNSADPINIVIRTTDVDCLIIALGCFKTLHDLCNSLVLWLEVGVESKGNLRYISINNIYDAMGELMCHSLPAFHAFFGCDYQAAFSRKGKMRPMKLLEGSIQAQQAFADLGDSLTEITTECRENIERFVCTVYGKKKLSSVNDVRFQIFVDKYKVKKESQRITCVKKLDGSSLPPYSKVLLQKIRRTRFVARRWMSSTDPFGSQLPPLDYGWKLEDGKYAIHWFDGEIAPHSIDIILNEDTSDDDTSDDDPSEDTDDDDLAYGEEESSDEEDDNED